MMSLPCMDTHSLLPSSIAADPYATTSLSYTPSTAHNELPSYIHKLAEASLDHSTSAAAPPCRKRRALSDLAQEFSQFDGWKLHEEIGLDAHDSLAQLIHGDSLLALSDDQVFNPSLYSASHKCSDLEDVLNLLWMDDHDTASTTQSASSPLNASSDRVSLISDLDWDYGGNDSSSNQAESNDNPSSDNLQSLEVNKEGVIGSTSCDKEDPLIFNWESLQKKEAHSNQIWDSLQHQASRGSWERGTRASWQGGTRASWQEQRLSWQEKKQGGVRASWQDEIRASWQPKQEGGRASWQPRWQLHREEEQNRARWQAQGGGRGGEQPERGEGAVSASEKQSVDACGGGVALKSSRSGGAWAGPTLFDIESALALNDGSSNTASSLSSFSPIASPTPQHTLSSFFDLKKFLSDDPTKGTVELDSVDSSWRLKLQKRNSLEPKYTVRVESEEKALVDGYRWRKYGQKSIKNSPFPRSYYRCSSGKCNAKKQVEKCQEDAGIFLVTYEGIHLHHRPNPLHKFRTLSDLNEDKKEKTTSHLCSPSSSTSCSYSITPICSASSNHTLLT